MLMVAVRDRIDTFGITVIAYLGVIVGLVALMVGSNVPLLAVVFVIPYGAAYGIFSIARPVLAAATLGHAGFGAIAGMLALPYVFCGAVGPILSAILWSLGGYDLVLGLSVALVLFALFALFNASKLVTSQS